MRAVRKEKIRTFRHGRGVVSEYRTLSRIVLLGILLLLTPAESLAGVDQLFEEFGVGPRDVAMGNTGIAAPTDYAAVYYNPAGLAFQPGHHFTFGWKAVYKELYLELETMKGKNWAEDYPDSGMILIGITTDLDFAGKFSEFITKRFAFGLTMALGEYMKSFTIYADPTTPYMYLYNDRPVSMLPIYFSMSIKMFDWMGFGIGGTLAPSNTYADVTAHTDINASDQSYQTRQTIISRAFSKVEPVMGIACRWPVFDERAELYFGASWHDQVFTVDGSGQVATKTRVVLESGETIELPDTQQDMSSLTGFSPMQFGTGLGMSWNKNMAAADLVWKQWSKFRDQTENFPDPLFKDTVQVRIGAEKNFGSAVDWALGWSTRIGYYYQPTPVPDQSGPGNILDSDKHVLSLGFGTEFYEPTQNILLPIKADIAYQIHILEERITENDNDPDWGRIRSGGYLHQVTFAMTVDF